jgi:hypothetical protein
VTRAARGVLLAARRSAVDARITAQRQIHALVVAAPESLRSRFRAKTTYSVVRIATRLRVSAQQDLETKTTI